MAATSAAMAQTSRSSPPSIRPADTGRLATETARVLKEARESGRADMDRNDASKAAIRKATDLANKVRSEGATTPSYAERKKAEDSEAQLNAAMGRVSPEGRALLAQNAATPEMRIPGDSPASTPPRAVPMAGSGSGPQPQPLRPVSLTDPKKAPPQTVINAGTSFFDSRAGFGVFVDSVEVDHPQFHLTCDELQVFMDKSGEEDAAKPAGAGAGTATSPAPSSGALAASGAADQPAGENNEDQGNGSLKRAIAKGRKVVINKMSAKGVPQTGIGREADYDGKTGDVILRGWPQIQEGNSLSVAVEPTTYFVIKANGQFQAMGGRAQTRIVQKEEKKGRNGNPDAAGPAVPGAPPAPVLNNRPAGGQ